MTDARADRDGATPALSLRKARAGDVDAMRELINAYAREDRMLERSREFLSENLRDFTVAESDGMFAGCCALHVLTPDLAEIRSLAIPPAFERRGIGRRLVDACIQEARELGLRRVFALTLVPAFFERCGFTVTSLAHLPEKSAAECPICPKRFACDEVTLVLHLDGTRPEPLRAGEPVGYTRLFLHSEPTTHERSA
jgi:amino-acid N-acetyltransferase